MQILLPWQKPDLSLWVERSIHPLAARNSLPNPYHDKLEMTLGLEAPGPPELDGPYTRLEKNIFSYQVFGPEVAQPVIGDTPLKIGDTIGLTYHFLGLVRLFFASRVVNLYLRQEFENGWHSGFAYQTLEGHPEMGEETFEIRKDYRGAVSFRIEAWSQPNLWFVRLLTPLARAIQKSAARSAISNLSQVAVFKPK